MTTEEIERLAAEHASGDFSRTRVADRVRIRGQE